MDYSWPLFFMFAVAVFGVLKTHADTACPNMFVTAGLSVLSVVIADILVKLLVNTLPRKMLPDLRDKAVFVTGCDTGFGNLCARRLDALGVTVFAGCLFPEGPGATDLKATTSSNLHVVALDVTKQQQVDDAVKYVEKQLAGKGLWAVINNAGIGTAGEIDWSPTGTLQQIMAVNTFGVVRVTKAFLPMIRKSKGRIVCLSSLLGRVSLPGMVYYSMSKAAVCMFVDGLRNEMKKWSVSVHGIEPYAYATNILSSQSIKSMFRKSLEDCPQDTQMVYGNEHFDACEERLHTLVHIFASHKVHYVIDDMVDAAVGLAPKIRYVPGIIEQVLPRIYAMLPTEVVDFVIYLVLLHSKKPRLLVSPKAESSSQL